MGQAISYGTRRTMGQLRETGIRLTSISEQIGVSFSTVQRICSRYQQQGEQGLKPLYEHCGKSRPDRTHRMYRLSLWLHRHHPTWGAPLIHLKLSQKYVREKIPSVRTLQNWFKWSQESECHNKHPKTVGIWVDSPHDMWQVDAKEQGRLTTGEPLCWLTMTDEKSGSLITAPLFPPRPYLSSESKSFTRPVTTNIHSLGATQSDEIR
jgi:hypothetical protein